jgi:cellobiose phosphorylase
MLSVKTPLEASDKSFHRIGEASAFNVVLSKEGRFLHAAAGPHLLSRTVGNALEGGLGRLVLRERRESGFKLYPLIGVKTVLSEFGLSDVGARWQGEVDGMSIDLVLKLDGANSGLVWSASVRGIDGMSRRLDLVWMQDIGCASRGALESNEAYASHYLDEAVIGDPQAGPVLMFRQNLPQGGQTHPWVLASCLTGAASYATDAFDVYGNGYRCGLGAAGLQAESLSNRRYQYEFSCAALQSEPVQLQGDTAMKVAFGLRYRENHPEASSDADLADLEVLRELAKESEAVIEMKSIVDCSDTLARTKWHGESLSTAELQDLFPLKWRHLETRDATVLSFFTGAETHVVTAAKEAIVERPHGTVLIGKADSEDLQDVLATTVYMGGVFSSQTVLGNTAFHCLNTIQRCPLGLANTAGLRIYRESFLGWRLLGMPSVFSMDRDRVEWIYKLDGSLVRVSLRLDDRREGLLLSLEAEGEPNRYLLSNEVSTLITESELETGGACEGISSLLYRVNAPATLRGDRLAYGLAWDDNTIVESVGGSELLGYGGGDALSVIVTKPATTLNFAIAASFGGNETLLPRLQNTLKGSEASSAFWSDFNHEFNMVSDEDHLGRLSDGLKWYSHNALIHYASPHGLEQYSGAAWGTRDACQGPFEYFIAQQQYPLARRILLRTFGAQYLESGDWPQWFMHDEYADIAQYHSHGDIVVWPLKALGLYLQSTGDVAILDESVDYLAEGKSAAGKPETLASHVNRALDRIQNEFIPGTHLIRYGGGDWDDSLQPVNHDLASRLVSGWTVGLLAQSLTELQAALGSGALCDRIGEMAEGVRKDFREHVLIEGQVAGFLLYDESFDAAEPLLHPKDTRTGMHNRLIPMTRSILAGLLTREEADHQMACIAEHLKFPDGVRLMDRPAPYQGGLETFFKRAESAANFGREIGLQYVHAHIRYAEALAKLGDADGLYEALLTICPVAIWETVPNAAPRQANMYFSSSDGAFINRADAAENFEKLRDGSIEVKGGWRLYSSGPGLYTGIVLRQFLGLRELADAWVFDPVLPTALDGLTLDWIIEGHAVQIEYRVSDAASGPKTITCGADTLTAEREDNPYRSGGLVVKRSDLMSALKVESNLIVAL